AIHRHGLAGTRFTDWGVLAAPRYLGRSAMAVALQRFAAEGAWGLSPHLIPHHSLHSVSGTISQALKINGPNIGVGGGPGSGAEAFLAATALLSAGQVPGVWVVLTGWDPEYSGERPVRPGLNGHAHTTNGHANGHVHGLNGHAPAGPLCGAVALALV